MIRHANGEIVDVGPRSAHIAGLQYASFAESEKAFDGARLAHLRPTEHDAADYVVIETEGDRYALTPTCAANALGMIPEGAFARGNRAAALAAFRPLAEAIGLSVEAAAQRVLDISCRKVSKQVEELIAEYQLDRATVELIGGGGGAASLVPHAAILCGLQSRLARKAEVISTIGVALAMVRDTVERNIVEPSPDDILQVRREAAEAVVKAGALPETVEVQVEVDTRRNLVRATAFGTTELKKREGSSGILDRDGCRIMAARSMQVDTEQARLAGETTGLYVFVANTEKRSLFGLIKSHRQLLRVTDRTGVVRLQRAHAEVISSSVIHIARDLEQLLTRLTDFGDAGRALPDVHVLVGARLINLSGLADAEQAIKLAGAELEALPPEEPLVIVATPKGA
jgi:hypothetical protein